jgi:hypothetical protein
VTRRRGLPDPPPWLDALVRSLIPADREAISGDLLEDYRDLVVGGHSRVRAASRLVMQALTVFVLMPRRHRRATVVLGALCGLSAAGMAWFAFQTSNSVIAAVACVLIGQSVVTGAGLRSPRGLPPRILQPGSIAAVGAGGLALAETILWTAFEWKAALTGAALVAQGVLTIALSVGWFGGLAGRSARP